MTYTALDTAKPDWTTQTGTQLAQSIRDNVRALRDNLVATGLVPGFDYTPAGGTAEQPAQFFFKRGTEWIRIDVTWGSSGGSDGSPTKLAYYYSSNSGGAYDGMADAAGKYVLSISYDASGNVTATTWGLTP